jgi:arylsulfatase A-like enzyme
MENILCSFHFVFTGHKCKHSQTENDARGKTISEDYRKNLRHAYAACVSSIDSQLGKLMAQLKKMVNWKIW